MLFNGEAKLGFTSTCWVSSLGACDADEVCVARISNQDQGHIADCNDNTMPMLNAFANRICCSTPKEYCRDGIDNTGDGLIDCASPDCHPSANNLQTPQQCAPGPAPGNNQSTADCIESTSFDIDGNALTTYKPHCIGPHPIFTTAPYYCNYGHSDNSSIEPDGFCCPAGQWYDSSLTPPRCREFLKCGITSGFMCEHSFFDSFSPWLNNVFDGGFNWCNSRLPIFTNEAGGSILSSEACCPVVHQGKFDYFIVDSNVKIFGAE